MVTINDFLSSAASMAKKGMPTTVVMGNESADLDSVVSSMVYAYALSQRSDEQGRAVVPIIDIPRADFPLRTESVFWLKHIGVEEKNLVFNDEVDVNNLVNGEGGRLVLVDHNKLSATYSACADRVVEIIDHHNDEGLYVDSSEGRRSIETVGSASTLVAEQILAHNSTAMDSVMAQLLVGAILVDTSNMDPAADRATPKDHDILARLKASHLPPGFDQNAAFEDLKREKFNQAGLSTKDLLRRDYKQWVMGSTTVGISSIGVRADEFLDPASTVRGGSSRVVADMAQYCSSLSLDILVVMFAFFAADGGFARQLALFIPVAAASSSKGSVLAGLKPHLLTSDLELAPLTGVAIPAEALGDNHFDIFAQNNSTSSRKQVQPLVDAYFTK